MSRLQKVKKNILASYSCQIITAVLSFICRTVFIHHISSVFLGVRGLFSNIFGLLALAEMGLGTSMNYEMYKPVAMGDSIKIVSLLRVYKKAYHLISVIILALGVILTPFLPYFVKDTSGIDNIYLYYYMFLLMTVFSYFSTYYFCYTNAMQKEYISSFFAMGLSIATNIIQIFVIIAFESFFLYLVVQIVCLLIQQLFISIYFRVSFKEVLRTQPEKLDDQTKESIKKNMGGLIFNKVSDVLNHQTDNIIIAVGINIVSVGYADNYNMIASMLKTMIMSSLTSVIPSLGNMAAVEDKKKCFEIFKIYDLVDYIAYGVCTVCMAVLFQPFVFLWAGEEKMISYYAMLLLTMSFYLAGRSHSFSNYKAALGVFYDIKITSIGKVIINIVLSIIGVRYFGLAGIYIGTCMSSLYYNIRTLRLAYSRLTGDNLIKYYMKRLFQSMIVLILILVGNGLALIFNPYSGWGSFVLFGCVIILFSFMMLLAIYCKSYEYKQIKGIVLSQLKWNRR